ncbi:MAG: hypothetical protein M0Q90_11495 [Bacteroidales bacterium]|nr:hypothetical protein [Bacteroidales bacterium]
MRLQLHPTKWDEAGASSHPEFDLRSFYGAWNGSRDSDAIIKEIRDSRVDKSAKIQL